MLCFAFACLLRSYVPANYVKMLDSETTVPTPTVPEPGTPAEEDTDMSKRVRTGEDEMKKKTKRIC